MVDEDRGKVKVDLGAPGPVELWFPFGARRKLKGWLEKNRPDELIGSPSELSLPAYFWAGLQWQAKDMTYEQAETLLDQATVSTISLVEAAQNAVFYATVGKTHEEWLAEQEKNRGKAKEGST